VSKMPSNELRSEFPPHKHGKHSKSLYSSNKHNTHTGLDIRASLGLSNNWGGRGIFGGLPRCKEADLMTADSGWPTDVVPGAAGEEGEAHTSVSGRQGRSQQLW
jgi:hypothetical protein